ncbi:hypothetical protein [Streptomyces sp. MNU89]|uniref:hypothetical protein n=1 Tax=Streptomyces sp. MNU89 TaxID=2560025 RepID=UPI001E2F2BA2|nr:hypothetical protein [Streptomyces sp. MNU89]MCC9740333.1 hypothetical protein [Streptomyces sp. MNU89]
MAKQFRNQEIAYKRDVHGISMGNTWTGLSAEAANHRFAATLKELQNAQVQAKAVASLLRDAHTQFTDLRKKLDSARADALAADMTVSEEGVVAFDTEKFSDSQRTALHHDPGYQQSVRTAVSSWQARIDKLVKDIGDADRGVEIALHAVVIDSEGSDGSFTGFNGQALGDIEKYEAAATKDARTKTNGWVADGQASSSGPGVGTSANGPDTGSGKMREIGAHADLGRAGAEGSLTNGPMKLAGTAEAFAGAKASASGGITNEGIKGSAGVFAGGEATASGRADVGPVGVYGRTGTTAGAEASVNSGVSLDDLGAGAEAFAGAKGSVATGADLGGIGVGVTAEGWAGAGAEANLNYSKDNSGLWAFSAKAGISPIVGGALGFEFTVDPGKVADTAGDAADAVGDMFDSVL